MNITDRTVYRGLQNVRGALITVRKYVDDHSTLTQKHAVIKGGLNDIIDRINILIIALEGDNAEGTECAHCGTYIPPSDCVPDVTLQWCKTCRVLYKQ